MNQPVMRLQVELWNNASEFVKYGIPWYMKVIWYLTNRKFYYRMVGRAKVNQLYARGFYDRFRDKIVLCLTDIALSTIDSFRHGSQGGSFHLHYGLQFYFTLVHEMLHKANVAKDDYAGQGHRIDFDRFERLPETLKDLFDGLLELENSGDAFRNHPDNRRNEDGKTPE